MAERKTEEEKRLAPFEDLGFVIEGSRGNERYGSCPFCGASKKFHVNTITQKWSCKAGSCQKEGNLTTYLEEWFTALEGENESGETSGDWKALAEERGIPVPALKAADIQFGGLKWVIPIYNQHGRLCNIRFFDPRPRTRVKMRGVSGIEMELYGIEQLLDAKKKSWPVWLVEGEWDVLALRVLLKRARKLRVIVVGVPGAGTFKPLWSELLSGRDIVCCYDNDMAGNKGKDKAYKMLHAVAKSLVFVNWLDSFPEGFDLRDHLKQDGDFEELEELIGEYEPEGIPTESAVSAVDSFPLLRDGTRPSLRETFDAYRRRLKMTPDMEDALRVIYAVVITTQIPGDPLWVHIAGPPGACKTELVMSCSLVANTFSRSTVTVHSLVSGWKSNGTDPSLIPMFYGKAFLLKDYTELLNLPAPQKHEIGSIFRGAYDGRVEKSFGNGVTRIFEGFFNMLSGVTPAIFAERDASLGERFLIFHMQKGTGLQVHDVIRMAFDSVGREREMKAEIGEAAKAFLEYKIVPEDIPDVSDEIKEKCINLAQLLSYMRASTTRDITRERFLYRAQTEVGTRPAKQIHKLLLGLGLQNNPPSIGAEEYRICSRVVIDSCIGWNMDSLRVLIAEDGLTLDDICERADIPKTTLRDQLEELTMLGVLRKEVIGGGYRGRPSIKYHVKEAVRAFWNGAELPVSKRLKGKLRVKKYTRAEIVESKRALEEAPRILRRRRKP